MTQRIQTPVPSSEALIPASVDITSGGAMDRLWLWGYMAICLLAITAVVVIARGGAPDADMGLVTVVIDGVPLDICRTNGDQRPGPAGQTCANPHGSHAPASGVC